jgi:hypothetical protein
MTKTSIVAMLDARLPPDGEPTDEQVDVAMRALRSLEVAGLITSSPGPGGEMMYRATAKLRRMSLQDLMMSAAPDEGYLQ